MEIQGKRVQLYRSPERRYIFYCRNSNLLKVYGPGVKTWHFFITILHIIITIYLYVFRAFFDFVARSRTRVTTEPRIDTREIISSPSALIVIICKISFNVGRRTFMQSIRRNALNCNFNMLINVYVNITPQVVCA